MVPSHPAADPTTAAAAGLNDAGRFQLAAPCRQPIMRWSRAPLCDIGTTLMAQVFDGGDS